MLQRDRGIATGRVSRDNLDEKLSQGDCRGAGGVIWRGRFSSSPLAKRCFIRRNSQVHPVSARLICLTVTSSFFVNSFSATRLHGLLQYVMNCA